MHRLTVTGYEVTIAPGSLAEIGDLLDRAAPAHRYAVITDQHVAPLHGERLRSALGPRHADLLVIPAGEQEKSRQRWAELTDRLLALGAGRDAAIIALGGGVVGDIAGFVAATYMRGIPYVQIPTTLLAMVDSSIGGKTGVDTPAGKNLVGAFHRPAAVLIDPEILATLGRADLAAGFAEVIKHGVIADAEYFDLIEASAPELLDRTDPDLLARIIRRSVEIKAAVVEQDERERGERMVLNFGHTIGHAIESLSGYSMLHGEAVAIGMSVESRCGELLGITAHGTAERIGGALRRFGLPVERPATMEPEAIVERTASDKKARAGQVEYALPTRIGKMARITAGRATAVPPALVEGALR